jgi:hypothetical protein
VERSIRYGIGVLLIAMLSASTALAQTFQNFPYTSSDNVAANINRQHLHTRLRLGRDGVPKYVYGDRVSHSPANQQRSLSCTTSHLVCLASSPNWRS